MAEVAPAPVVADAAPAEVKEVFTVKSALKVVLRNSLFNEGLCRGLHEAVKALDRDQAHLCVLSNACNESAYKKLITALCKERNVPLITVEDGKIIGEYSGLARLKPDGTPAKIINCSCAVVREWGIESEARAFLLNHLQNGGK